MRVDRASENGVDKSRLHARGVPFLLLRWTGPGATPSGYVFRARHWTPRALGWGLSSTGMRAMSTSDHVVRRLKEGMASAGLTSPTEA